MMATTDIEKVLTMFEGIARRDADIATKYMNPKNYIQHNPHFADAAVRAAGLPLKRTDLRLSSLFTDQSDGFSWIG